MESVSSIHRFLGCLGFLCSALLAGAATLVLVATGLPLAPAWIIALIIPTGVGLLISKRFWPARGVAIRRASVLIAVGLIAWFGWSTLWGPWDLPYEEARDLPGVSFWQLSTGSRIAYVHHRRQPESEVRRIAGRRIAGSPAAGSPDRRPPVLFLHGGPGLPELPNPQVAAALTAAGFDVYGYHQFGAGLSSRALSPRQEYTVDRQVQDLEAIRQELAADRLILVGQSWGGALAGHYAAAFPRRVELLVLTSPAPLWLPAVGREAISSLDLLDPEDQHLLREFIGPWIPRLALHRILERSFPGIVDRLMRERDYAAFNQGQFAIAKKTLACNGNKATGLKFPGQGGLVNRFLFADMERITDPRPKLAAVEAPVLLMRAECDYVDRQVVDDYAQHLPNAEVVGIPGAGHEIQLEQPEAYRRFLLRHLTDGGRADAPEPATAPPTSAATEP